MNAPRPVESVILLATTNPGKRNEFRALLPLSVRVLTLDDVSVSLPRETGTTFAMNAAAKALAAARQTGLLALADDSGLEVDALSGAPGVRSARFGGEPPSDERNRLALVDAMINLSGARRSARFVCAVAVAKSGVVVATAEGTCTGMIRLEPKGIFGFGYDSLFTLPDGRSMAELEPYEKNRISHRASAFQRILPDLLRELGILASNGQAR
jgi:XTP/dITP diphosphohydrolase